MPDEAPRGGQSAIETSSWGDFRVRRRRGSPDFLPFAERLSAGEEVGDVLADHPGRKVRLIEADGRRYVLKWDRTPPGRWEKRLGEAVRGPYYSRLMPMVNRAVENGLDIIQNIHFVAERVENGLCREAILVLDYLPGTPLASRAECGAHAGAVAEALTRLHGHGLAMGDLNYRNFLLDGDAIRIIDLSARGCFLLARAKDRSRARMMYKIRLAGGGPAARMLDLGVHMQQTAFYLLRRVRDRNKVNMLYGRKGPRP
ncbi:MAG: hypothetical protein LBJ46_07220 [Planctomycetota bacterium]|jgi:heptose II phosphotransferase|nr:hypothetical protein [Planctomycetota bacterium]